MELSVMDDGLWDGIIQSEKRSMEQTFVSSRYIGDSLHLTVKHDPPLDRLQNTYLIKSSFPSLSFSSSTIMITEISNSSSNNENGLEISEDLIESNWDKVTDK